MKKLVFVLIVLGWMLSNVTVESFKLGHELNKRHVTIETIANELNN